LKEPASMKTALCVAFFVVTLCLVCEAVQVQVSSRFNIIHYCFSIIKNVLLTIILYTYFHMIYRQFAPNLIL